MDDLDLEIERGRVPRPARPERLRQDDDAALPGRSRDARRRAASRSATAPSSTRRPRVNLPPDKREHRHGVPVLRAVAAHDGAQERRLSAEGARGSEDAPRERRVEEVGGARRLRRTCSTATRRSSAVASSSGSRSPAGSSRVPTSCSSTSRCPTSTRVCATSSGPSSTSCTASSAFTAVYVTHDQTEALALGRPDRDHARRARSSSSARPSEVFERAGDRVRRRLRRHVQQTRAGATDGGMVARRRSGRGDLRRPDAPTRWSPRGCDRTTSSSSPSRHTRRPACWPRRGGRRFPVRRSAPRRRPKVGAPGSTHGPPSGASTAGPGGSSGSARRRRLRPASALVYVATIRDRRPRAASRPAEPSPSEVTVADAAAQAIAPGAVPPVSSTAPSRLCSSCWWLGYLVIVPLVRLQ